MAGDGFAALMALSRSQTQQSEKSVQSALADRQKREAERRKQQQEKERREKALAAKLRMKHFDEQQKAKELEKQRQEKRRVEEERREQQEARQSEILMFGPKKAKSTSSSTHPDWPSRKNAPKSRSGLDNNDQDVRYGMTWEEKRAARARAERAREERDYAGASSKPAGYRKAGQRLPGGAVNLVTTDAVSMADYGHLSTKERLKAMPNTLVKLNVVKRDTRTIDEIVQDRAKAKILSGESARSYDQWFTSKKTDHSSTVPSSGVATSSRERTGSPANSLRPLTKPVNGSSTQTPDNRTVEKVDGSSKRIRRDDLSTSPPHRHVDSPSVKLSKASAGKAAEKARTSTVGQKRARSPDRLQSPPSKSRRLSPTPKRRSAAEQSSRRGRDLDANLDISKEIWSLFGRKREQYVGMDVYSDDEDMEVDASAVEREEKFSARLAKKEDMEALEEERRHEEEKRRRKKEMEKRNKFAQCCDHRLREAQTLVVALVAPDAVVLAAPDAVALVASEAAALAAPDAAAALPVGMAAALEGVLAAPLAHVQAEVAAEAPASPAEVGTAEPVGVAAPLSTLVEPELESDGDPEEPAVSVAEAPAASVANVPAGAALPATEDPASADVGVAAAPDAPAGELAVALLASVAPAAAAEPAAVVAPAASEGVDATPDAPAVAEASVPAAPEPADAPAPPSPVGAAALAAALVAAVLLEVDEDVEVADGSAEAADPDADAEDAAEVSCR
ncbi:hypothetical protein FISHEDRAFT_62267 [Fistulina hepatica ATCC 64428]|nr:hypothetical protein FISHEDRAFT_62267 [Fistulina hepatica ATCC 64428]